LKKILFILHVPPPVHGSSVVGQFIKESGVINRLFDAQHVNLGTSRSVDEIGKNPLGKIGRYFSILWQVLVQLVHFRPDLCYLAITAKGPAFFKDAVPALLAKLFRVRLVYHFHNKGVSTCQHRTIYHFFYQLVFRNTDAILLSQYLYPDIQKYFPENRVQYCPDGIPQISIESPEEAGGARGNQVEILFLSNLLETKGVLVLQEACRLLKNQNLPFHCTFVGGDADLTVEQCRRLAEASGLSETVTFVGKKYGGEKESAFAQTDIFAFPTYNETFGLVLLEAMQHSLPVVASIEGGIPDIVDDGVTGYLVPKKDADRLAEKLAVLINDPELRKKMGCAGREKFVANYTLEIFEQRMALILTQVATGC
jgi:glycosyltransferase involved in cell wall biosynthesis